MSRQINQPVASVKLTNVATVRLTVHGQRFEVACYKNKVLDYRAGLETDLSEVLQTNNVFTSVAKGQFAAAADLARAFGERATLDDVCVQILTRGQSLQVSEEERHQLYESCLTQIATMIATHCIHPGTGKPYTVPQIKHALTKSTTVTPPPPQPETAVTKPKKSGHRGKSSQKQPPPKHHVPPPPPPPVSFVVQPHKPIKQQYLQALKYLQQSRSTFPIQRACMELQWQYTTDQQDRVTAALRQFDIHATAVTTGTTTTPSEADATTTTAPTEESSANANAVPCSSTFLVDPSVYRPLQEQAGSTVPGSRLEILRQQVFQASTATTTGSSDASTAQLTTRALLSDQKSTAEEAETSRTTTARISEVDVGVVNERDVNSDSSSDDDDYMTMQKAKAKKKQQKKAQRRQEKHQSSSDDSSASSLPIDHEPKEEWVVLSKEEEEESLNLANLQVASGFDPTRTAAAESSTANNINLANEENENDGVPPCFSCNTCVGTDNVFRTQSEYRAHFRSDWHRFNQKLKSQGAAASAVSLHEFEQCDAETFFATDL